MFKPCRITLATALLVAALGFTGCSSETKARREPTPTAEKYLEDAREQLDSNHMTEARALLELAREEGAPPRDAARVGAEIERESANAAIEDGEVRRAYELFLKASELEPHEEKRFQDLLAAIEAGRQAGVMPGELAPVASRAVELKTRSKTAQQLAARLWDDAGEPERALPYYAWLHKVSPEDTSTTLRLATLYLADDQFRLAKRLLEKVHEAEPGNVIAALKLADLYARLSEHPKADALYARLVEAYPERASILMRYARYLRQRGETERARQLQQRAQEARPGMERKKMRRLR